MLDHKRIASIAVIALLCCSYIAVGLGERTGEQIAEEAEVEIEILESAVTEAPPSASILGVYETAGVSADGVPCAQIGADVLARNGTAIDAAIASLFCLGVVNTQSTGIGGGFILTYYERRSGQVFTLDAREVAPGAATADMYFGDSSLSKYGGLAVAVPGETKGYYEAYQRFGGGVPWEELIEPTIAICEGGYPVNYHMANALESKETYILDEPSMSVFVNNETGRVWQEGDILYRNDLAPTLRILQQEPDALYTGSLSDAFQQDLVNLGSIITKEDLNNYTVRWRNPILVHLANGDHTIHSFPPPGSGGIYAFILNVLDNYNFTASSLDEADIVTTYQRVTEAFKYGYAERTKMGDPDFVDMTGLVDNLTSDAYAFDVYSRITDNQTFQDPAHYGAYTSTNDFFGTSHLSVLAPNGDAVAVTGTVNWYFGAVIKSESTGIVLNNEMDDFETQNDTTNIELSPNKIEPGKRPVSSMSPSILVDKEGDVRLIIGGAGGTHITTATAWSSLQNIWFGSDIKEAIDSRRLHHQLTPMILQYEEEFRDDIVLELEDIGHITREFEIGTSIVCGVSIEDGTIYANSDFRKRGEVDGF